MKRKRANLPYPMNVLDPWQLFDLICAKNYFAGQFDKEIPVEESRLAFNELIKMIKQ